MTPTVEITDASVAETSYLLNGSRLTARDLSDKLTRDHARCILLSTVISRFGSRTWEFATPLLLLEWSPGSLAAPAALGLTCAFFRTSVSPMLGRLADEKWDRMSTVWLGTGMQAGGCLLSVGALILWNKISSNPMSRVITLLMVILAGVMESLGSQLASVAVKKEWLPIVFDEDNTAEIETQTRKKMAFNIIFPEKITLSFINTTMTNIDLMSAMFGPLLAGYTLELLASGGGKNTMQYGFSAIALFNVFSFIPEILLLKQVFDSCQALQEKPQSTTNASHDNTHRFSSTEKENPWITWYKHPSGVPLLTISLASLYLTALSPAGTVLTAYLVTIDLSPTSIGLFRACGAMSGVVGISLFSLFRRYNDRSELAFEDRAAETVSSSVRSIERLRRVSLVCLLLEVVSILVAAVAYYSYRNTTVQVPKPLSWQMLLFLSSIVISRAGLYSFDVGVLEIEQYIVDERCRNAVGSVEGALCSFAEMCMYILSIALPNPDQFGWQVGISATAVSFGGAAFGLFTCLYHMHLHHHHESGHCQDHNHIHGHSHHDHTHTLQQERDLKDGYHVHLHRHIMYPKFM
jgi:iron-regulated transporter 1